MSLRTAKTLILLALAIPLAVGCSDLGNDVMEPQLPLQAVFAHPDSLPGLLIGFDTFHELQIDTLSTGTVYPPPRSPKEGWTVFERPN